MQQVETFFCEESQSLITEPEELDKWRAKIEELELDGQKELTRENNSHITFRPMSSEEHHIYETLLEVHTEVERFSKKVIPIRALSAIALARQEKYFSRIEVWYDHEYNDPLIVGVGQNPERTWENIYYMIARFGSTLKSLDELRIDARDKLLPKIKVGLELSISERKAQLDNVESLVDSFLRGNTVRFLT